MTTEACPAVGRDKGLLAALDLAAIIVRRLDGKVLHWSIGMSDLLGWDAADVVGRVPHDLLRTRFPGSRSEIEAELLQTGNWTGGLVYFTRDGRPVTALSRWQLHHDGLSGETVVVETNSAIKSLPASELTVEAPVSRVSHEAESRSLIAREMGHRLRNALAIVAAVASQTLRQSSDNPARFVKDFTGRLCALGRAHDLLMADSWQQGTDLAAIISAALAPWPSEAIHLSSLPGAASPNVGPQQAQALVLGLHELATNATKHGALSCPEGQIAISWEVDAGGIVTLQWTETGGPMVSQSVPKRRGFGSDLLLRALPRQLGAEASVSVTCEAEGAHAVIRFTLESR